MKTFIFICCTLPLVAFAIFRDDQFTMKIGSDSEHYTTCLTEKHMSDDDMFTVQDIIDDKHELSENEEKVHKNGGVLKCIMKKMELLDGSNYVTEKIHAEMVKTDIHPGEMRYQNMDNCLDSTKDIEDVREKCFALMKCAVKAEQNDPSLHPPTKVHGTHE
jgi:hypothetical protein